MLLLLDSCENNSKLDLQICAPINKASALFATWFAVIVESVAVHLQMELIDMQCNTELKTKFT